MWRLYLNFCVTIVTLAHLNNKDKMVYIVPEWEDNKITIIILKASPVK